MRFVVKIGLPLNYVFSHETAVHFTHQKRSVPAPHSKGDRYISQKVEYIDASQKIKTGQNIIYYLKGRIFYWSRTK